MRVYQFFLCESSSKGLGGFKAHLCVYVCGRCMKIEFAVLLSFQSQPEQRIKFT